MGCVAGRAAHAGRREMRALGKILPFLTATFCPVVGPKIRILCRVWRSRIAPKPRPVLEIRIPWQKALVVSAWRRQEPLGKSQFSVVFVRLSTVALSADLRFLDCGEVLEGIYDCRSRGGLSRSSGPNLFDMLARRSVAALA